MIGENLAVKDKSSGTPRKMKCRFAPCIHSGNAVFYVMPTTYHQMSSNLGNVLNAERLLFHWCYLY